MTPASDHRGGRAVYACATPVSVAALYGGLGCHRQWEEPVSTTHVTSTAAPNGLVGSVSRALRVLEIVAAAGDGVPAKAVARRGGLKLSTTYHLLHTLVHEGYLVRLEGARGYGLGYKVTGLHAALQRELLGSARVTAALTAAHQEAGAPIYLGVLRDAHLVIADVIDSPEAPRAKPLDVGFHEAAHASAYGKVLLAHMPDTDRREYLASYGLTRLTEHTITSPRDLEDELLEVRASGLATEAEQFQPDLACVAAPVRDAAGSIVAAIAASAPVRYFVQHRDRMLAAVRGAAAGL